MMRRHGGTPGLLDRKIFGRRTTHREVKAGYVGIDGKKREVFRAHAKSLTREQNALTKVPVPQRHDALGQGFVIQGGWHTLLRHHHLWQ